MIRRRLADRLRLALAVLLTLLAQADQEMLRQATMAETNSAAPMMLWLALAAAKRDKEKRAMRCRFSGSQEIPQQQRAPGWRLLAVECPECGAIRRPKRIGFEQQEFAAHEDLEGTARERRRYKKIDGTWQIVGESNEEMGARR